MEELCRGRSSLRQECRLNVVPIEEDAGSSVRESDLEAARLGTASCLIMRIVIRPIYYRFAFSPNATSFNGSFSFAALSRIAFCVRLSCLAIVAISFEDIIKDRSLSSSSGVHKGLRGTTFRLRVKPQLDKPAFKTETAPAMENWSRQPVTVSPWSSLGGWDRRSAIDSFPAQTVPIGPKALFGPARCKIVLNLKCEGEGA